MFAVDVLRCVRCEGPMRLEAVVDDERVAAKILAHVGLPARAPPRGRPRRLGQLELLADVADHDGIDPPLMLVLRN